MRVHALPAFGEPIVPMEAPCARPGPGEALVKVTRAGLCHSDLHIQDGYFSLGDGLRQIVQIPLPAVLGHEIEGEVAEMGGGVSAPSVGARVAVYPWLGCGACAVCGRGDQQLCAVLPRRALGVARWGGMAEYVHVPDTGALIPIDGLAPGLGAIAMCSGLTAYSALKKIGVVHADEPIALIGMGGVGLMALALAKVTLANPIIAVDIDPKKRRAARRYGAQEAIDPMADDAPGALLGGVGAVIDFVGTPQTFAFGASMLRRAGTYVAVGLYGGAASLPLATVPLRALTIRGSYVGREDEARELVALLQTGTVRTPPIEERSLEAANEALDDLRAGRVVGRIVLKP